MAPTVLVVGAGGFIGSRVLQQAPVRVRAIGLTGVRDMDSRQKIAAAAWKLAVEHAPLRLDGVFFCQGLGPSVSWLNTDSEHCSEMMTSHLFFTIRLLAELMPHMREDASVVQLGSVASADGSFDPSYAAAQAAKESLSGSIRRVLPRARVGTVQAGLVSGSPIERNMSDDFRRRHLEKSRGGQLVQAESVAEAMWFFYNNPAASSSTLRVDFR